MPRRQRAGEEAGAGLVPNPTGRLPVKYGKGQSIGRVVRLFSCLCPPEQRPGLGIGVGSVNDTESQFRIACEPSHGRLLISYAGWIDPSVPLVVGAVQDE